jgi:hypothetical protein
MSKASLFLLPSNCDSVESIKTFVFYKRRGGQKIKAYWLPRVSRSLHEIRSISITKKKYIFWHFISPTVTFVAKSLNAVQNIL